MRFTEQIRGTSFGLSAYDCLFGENETGSTEAQHIAAGLLECPIPQAPTDSNGKYIPGMTSLRIVSTVGFTSNRVQFTYFKPPVLLGALPSFGSRDGGTRVLVTGLGFVNHGGVSCSFDGVENPGKVLSTSQVACTSPAKVLAGPTTGEAHVVTLLVTMNGLHYGNDSGAHTRAVTYEYVDNPMVSFISPTNGPSDAVGDVGGGGGNQTSKSLRVYGAHFRDTVNLACRFGIRVTMATYVSSSEAHCRIPTRSSATGDEPAVAVTANGVDFSRERSPSTTFTYVDAPKLFGLSPALGPNVGGTEIVLFGNGFSGGAKSVRQASLLCRFRLEAWATKNTRGSSSNIGDEQTWDVRADIESESVAKCVSPAVTSREGYAAVGVSSDGGWSFSTSSLRFYFHAEVVVASLAPATIPASGAGDIVVSGKGFLFGEGLPLCLFSGASDSSKIAEQNVLTTAAVWLSSELLQCEAPTFEIARGTSTTFKVRVTNNGVDASASAAEVVVYSPLDLLSLTPASGPRAGGTFVKLVAGGWGLPPGSDLDYPIMCQWRGALVTPGNVSEVDTAKHVVVVCASPPESSLLINQDSHLMEGGAPVTLLISGRNAGAAEGLPFLYYDPPAVKDASPPAAGPAGDTEVVLTGSGFWFGAPGQPGSGKTMCMFGNFTVSAVVVSDSELRCRIPRLSGSILNISTTGVTIDIKVSLNGGVDFGTSSVPFYFFPDANTTGKRLTKQGGHTKLVIIVRLDCSTVRRLHAIAAVRRYRPLLK